MFGGPLPHPCSPNACVGVAALDSGRGYRRSVGVGPAYALSLNAQLDGGPIIGLAERTTDDVTLFAGLSLRF